MNQPEKIPVKKKILGAVFIAIGFLALITPLTPGSWLIFVGLEMAGIRIFFGRSIKGWLEHLRQIKRKK